MRGKLIGWACPECGAVYSDKRDAEDCEERHFEEQQKIEDEAMEALRYD